MFSERVLDLFRDQIGVLHGRRGIDSYFNVAVNAVADPSSANALDRSNAAHVHRRVLDLGQDLRLNSVDQAGPDQNRRVLDDEENGDRYQYTDHRIQNRISEPNA